MSRVNSLLALAAALPLGACSTGPGPGADADAGDGGEGGSDGPAFEVTPPALPVLTPCPEGWEEVPPEESGGVTTCEPWPDGDPVTPPQMTPCPDGWREVTDPDTGTVTCDPWPDGDPAAPPALTPCPDGWREVTDPETGTVTCDPWPEGGASACEGDEVQFPGEPGCRRLGTECPAGDWAEDLPGGPVLYVRAGGAPGGDGSRAAPFGTIAEATAAAAAGTTVALAKGTYDEAVTVPAGVTLRGACVAETIVASSEASETEATIAAAGADVGVRNLMVGGNRMGLLADGAGVALNVADVLVVGAVGRGLLAANGASITAAGLVVRDTRGQPSDRTRGRGLAADTGSQVDVTRGVFERNRDVGVLALAPGTQVGLTDVVVRDTQGEEASRTMGYGVAAFGGATVEATRGVLERNRADAVIADGSGSRFQLRDVVIRETQAQESDGLSGEGVWVQAGAVGDLARVTVERNHAAGAVAVGAETMLQLADVVVRDTRPQESDGAGGDGIWVENGAHAEVVRAALERNRATGAAVVGSAASLQLTDVVVRDTEPQESDGTGGEAVWAEDGAVGEVARAVLERNHEAGAVAVGAGTSLELTDVVVRDMESAADGSSGAALVGDRGATVRLTGGLLERSREVAVSASGSGTALTLRDLVVRDTLARENDGTFGQGLAVHAGATVEVDRGVFERNRQVAISVAGGGGTATLRDVVVRDTSPQESDYGFGRGLDVMTGGRVDGERLRFDRNHEVGVFASDADSTVTLRDVAIRDTLSRQYDFAGGRGLVVQDGAQLTLSGGVLDRNRETAAYVDGDGAVLDMEDVIIRDTMALESDGQYGRGLVVQSGASCAIERASFVRNRDGGVFVAGVGADLVLTDAVILDTLPQDVDLMFGRGLAVQPGGQAQATRVLVQGSREAGILVAGPDAALTLVDVVVRDTASQEGDGKYGRALEAQGGARLDATRVLLEGNRDVAFKAAEAGTVVEIEDLTVRGTLGEASDGAYGRAVQAQDEAQVSIARALLRGNRELSASVFGAGSELRMTDVAIEGTLVTECSIDGRCATDLGGGTGIGAYCEGHAEVTRFHVWDSALCGVQLARGVDVATGRCSTGGTMDLHHGEVAHNAVCGANVQTEGFDVDRLMDDVLFYENGLNLDMAELPVPEGGVPIGE